MLASVKERFLRLIIYDRSAHRVALSACVGIYIAFSPFIGMHTAMVLLFSWMFALNCAVVFAVSCLINNPWTMVPVYGVGYWFGDLCMNFLGLGSIPNPACVQVCTEFISNSIGLPSVSVWALLVGGNLLGLALSIGSYPFIKRYASCALSVSAHKARRTFTAAKRVVQTAQPVLRRVRSKQSEISV